MTLKRIRTYAAVMAVALWTVLAIDYSVPGPLDRLGKPKGTDFFHFYVLGSLVREGRADLLFDMDAQTARGRAVAAPAREYEYVPMNSPELALDLAALARLAYPAALAPVITVMLVAYAASCWMIWRRSEALRRYPRETIACAVAFPALYATVLHGQNSFISF